VPQRELGLRGDVGEWCAQLVRELRCQLLLVAQTRRQTVEQAVES
jgi:hypothetical protein